MFEYFKVSGMYSFLFIHTFVMMFTTRHAVDVYRDDLVCTLRNYVGKTKGNDNYDNDNRYRLGRKAAQILI